MVKVRVDNNGASSRVFVNGVEVKGVKSLSVEHGGFNGREGKRFSNKATVLLEVEPDELRFDGYLDEDRIGYVTEDPDYTPSEKEEDFDDQSLPLFGEEGEEK